MRCGIIRWLTGGLATILALIVSSNVVQGGYTPPVRSGSLMDELSSFVGDFGQWNASLNNLPVQIMASAPAADQGAVLLGLFWFWLQELRSASSGSEHSPSGSILMSRLEKDLPPLLSNGGKDPPGIGGGSSLLNDPPSHGGDSGQQFGNDPPVLGSNGGPDLPADATPAPASISLLAIGIAGLLLGLRMRRKRLAR